jgi:hypothetical protein
MALDLRLFFQIGKIRLDHTALRRLLRIAK